MVGALAAVSYSSFLVSYLSPTGRSIDFVSELERAGAPYADWYRASDVVAGALMVALAAQCWRGRRSISQSGSQAIGWALIAVALVGGSSVLDSVSPMDCNPSVQTVCDIGDQGVTGLLRQLLVGHTVSGLVGFAAAGIGAAWCARVAWLGRSSHPMRVHIVLAATIGVCGLADLALLLGGADVGMVERVRIVAVSAWIAVVPWTVQACAQPAERQARQVTVARDCGSLNSTVFYGGNGHD